MSEIPYGATLRLDNGAPDPRVAERYGASELVVVRGAAGRSEDAPWWPLGDNTIHLRAVGQPVEGADDEVLLRCPVLAPRRGDGRVAVGIDGAIATAHPLAGGLESMSSDPARPVRRGRSAPPPLAATAPLLGSALDLVGFTAARELVPLPPGASVCHVALIDFAFGRWETLQEVHAGSAWAQVDAPTFEGLSRGLEGSHVASFGHGTLLGAALLMAAAPRPGDEGARVRLHAHKLIEADSSPDTVDPWLVATNLALALAAAYKSGARVAFVPLADTDFGMPPLLDLVLREVTRGGLTVVAAVGAPSHDQHQAPGASWSTAQHADQLAASPWVIGVGACDARGRWCRRGVSDELAAPKSSHGPGVALAAPGSRYRIGDGAERLGVNSVVDDSSLASALVAAAAARVSLQNPLLTPREVRRVLTLTAFKPLVVDDRPGVTDAFNHFDRAGFNFKLGAGVLDAAAAALGAADPLCLALVLAGPACQTVASKRTMPMSDGVRHATKLHRRVSGGGDHPLLDAYLAARPSLVALALRCPAVLEELLWLARHVSALWRDGDSLRSWRGGDHGALVRRLGAAAVIAEEHAEAAPDPEAVVALVRRLKDALRDDPAGVALEGFLEDTLARERDTWAHYAEDD